MPTMSLQKAMKQFESEEALMLETSFIKRDNGTHYTNNLVDYLFKGYVLGAGIEIMSEEEVVVEVMSGVLFNALNPIMSFNDPKWNGTYPLASDILKAMNEAGIVISTKCT